MMGNYYHDDQVDHGFCDFREDISRPVGLFNLYYVVLRVKVGNSIWYHHTAMIIDGDLPSHIEAMKCIVRASLNRRTTELACVFIRNFITQDASVLDCTMQSGITKEINDRIANGAIFCDRAERFIVTGFAGKNQVILLEVAATDALDANKEAVKICSEQLNETLNPVDTIAVSPVMPEIIGKFEHSAPQLLELIRTQCKVG